MLSGTPKRERGKRKRVGTQAWDETLTMVNLFFLLLVLPFSLAIHLDVGGIHISVGVGGVSLGVGLAKTTKGVTKH